MCEECKKRVTRGYEEVRNGLKWASKGCEVKEIGCEGECDRNDRRVRDVSAK